jgi:DNA-directed RNA polymerase
MWGARQVNLEPGDRPADVYSAVADLVKEQVARDLEQGNPFAKALDGKITRKVVKQTVMTNVYGVTFAGAKKQVCKQLDAAHPNLLQETGFEPILLSSYIATLIFKALSTMFRGAHDIQSWLGEVGGRICTALTPDQLERIASNPDGMGEPAKSRGKKRDPSRTSTDDLLEQLRTTIVWTTPLRMPVAQPYRKSGTRTIPTCLQDLLLTIPERSDPVNRKKQLQGFPPNFIHSLDASHMMLSALQCHDLGLTFAAVHDSFWTHAANIDVMNSVLRDSFIRIHAEDVIGRLATEFQARYKGSMYLAKIDQSSAAGKKIAALRKKSRRSLKDELLLEYERRNLLNSPEPLLVEQGMAMVTPATIFEEMSADGALLPPVEKDELAASDLEDELSEDFVESEVAQPTDEDGDGVASADITEGGDGNPASRFLKLMRRSSFEETVVSARPGKKTKQKPTTQIWLPLKFPPVPKKVGCRSTLGYPILTTSG